MLRSTFATIGTILLFVQISFAQFNSIKIDSKNVISTMEITPADFSNWIALDEFSDFAKTTALTSKIYDNFRDDFDFIILISNQEEVPEGFPYYGKYIQVSNATEGIGFPVFNNTGLFGSSGKLKGILHLPYKHGILYGPFLHELMHCWANYALPTEIGGHWGFMGGNVRAQLGGFQQSSLQKNVNGNPKMFRVDGFGPFANGGNGVPYSELELYMMGLIPLSNVTSFDMLKGIKSVNEDISNNSKIIIEADSCINYNPAKIKSLLGDRIPNWQQSQKSFKVLFVIITPNPISQAESSYFNNQVEEFCRPELDSYSWLYNFWEATGGLAVLKADSLNASLKETATLVLLNENRPKLLLYPNPVVDELHIETNIDIERIRVFNLANQLIIDIPVNTKCYRMPMDMLQSGIYMISITCNNQTTTRKIVVE